MLKFFPPCRAVLLPPVYSSSRLSSIGCTTTRDDADPLPPGCAPAGALDAAPPPNKPESSSFKSAAWTPPPIPRMPGPKPNCMPGPNPPPRKPRPPAPIACPNIWAKSSLGSMPPGMPAAPAADGLPPPPPRFKPASPNLRAVAAARGHDASRLRFASRWRAV
eukprot:scaffold1151_cov126-Isochrysis_galbana.AAC.8